MTNPKHTDTSRSGDLVERLYDQADRRHGSIGSLRSLEWEAADRLEALEAENAAHKAEREQHEAFRQEVSDAVEAVFAGYHDAPIPWVVMRRKLEPFIIAKPDPLVEAVKEASNPDYDCASPEAYAEVLRAALAARGLKIVEDK